MTAIRKTALQVSMERADYDALLKFVTDTKEFFPGKIPKTLAEKYDEAVKIAADYKVAAAFVTLKNGGTLALFVNPQNGRVEAYTDRRLTFGGTQRVICTPPKTLIEDGEKLWDDLAKSRKDDLREGLTEDLTALLKGTDRLEKAAASIAATGQKPITPDLAKRLTDMRTAGARFQAKLDS